MCPHCYNLIIDIKQENIRYINYTGGKRSGVMKKLTCPHCGNQNINIDSYNPECGGVDKKHRFNI